MMWLHTLTSAVLVLMATSNPWVQEALPCGCHRPARLWSDRSSPKQIRLHFTKSLPRYCRTHPCPRLLQVCARWAWLGWSNQLEGCSETSWTGWKADHYELSTPKGLHAGDHRNMGPVYEVLVHVHVPGVSLYLTYDLWPSNTGCNCVRVVRPYCMCTYSM